MHLHVRGSALVIGLSPPVRSLTGASLHVHRFAAVIRSPFFLSFFSPFHCFVLMPLFEMFSSVKCSEALKKYNMQNHIPARSPLAWTLACTAAIASVELFRAGCLICCSHAASLPYSTPSTHLHRSRASLRSCFARFAACTAAGAILPCFGRGDCRFIAISPPSTSGVSTGRESATRQRQKVGAG